MTEPRKMIEIKVNRTDMENFIDKGKLVGDIYCGECDWKGTYEDFQEHIQNGEHNVWVEK